MKDILEDTLKEIFKEDDRVYLYPLGWGTVTEITIWDVVVNFDSIGNTRHVCGEVIKLLSFTEYTLEGFSQDRPEESPNKGDIVWIREMETKMYVPIVFIEAIKDHYVLSFNFIDIKTVHKDFVETKNPYI
jgi:hypothetical protein